MRATEGSAALGLELSRVSVAELRARFRVLAPDPRTLAALALDARAGARELAVQLRRRHEREQRETDRLHSLYVEERALAREPSARIAGVDEVGMGPLAGPVVAAAVVLPRQPEIPRLDDSKRLAADARREVERAIRDVALDVGIGMATREEIDRLNIHRAGLLAMRRAVEALGERPDLVAIDGRALADVALPQVRCVGGDRRIACIAAASVIAKEHRDRWMTELDRRHPDYGFASHMGYGTPAHLAALARLGPMAEHRMSFAPVRDVAAAHAETI